MPKFASRMVQLLRVGRCCPYVVNSSALCTLADVGAYALLVESFAFPIESFVFPMVSLTACYLRTLVVTVGFDGIVVGDTVDLLDVGFAGVVVNSDCFVEIVVASGDPFDVEKLAVVHIVVAYKIVTVGVTSWVPVERVSVVVVAVVRTVCGVAPRVSVDRVVVAAVVQTAVVVHTATVVQTIVGKRVDFVLAVKPSLGLSGFGRV